MTESMPIDDALTELVRTQMPFCELLGICAVRADPSEVVLQGTWASPRTTTGDVLHGGYLMALADSAGAVCAFLNLTEGATTATTSSVTDLFRAVRSGTVTARSTPVHVGRSSIVVQTDLVRDDGRLAARTTQTQAVIRP